MPTAATRVLVADDTPGIRGMLRLLLGEEGYDVVDEAADGRQAIALAALHEPDIAVLDVMMPELDGISTVPELRRAHPAMKVVVYSAHGAREMERVAIAAGAHAFIDKTDLVIRLVETLEEMATADALIP